MKFAKITAVMLAGVMLLAGCGNSGKNDTDTTNTAGAPDFDTAKTVMTIGDVDVNAGIFNFYYNSFYRQSGDAEQSKEAAAEQCKNNFLIVAVAHAKGVEFDEETQAAIDEYKQQVVDSYDGGYEDFLAENGLTDKDIDDIISVSYYAEELQKEIDTSEFTDEEKRQYFTDHYRRAKHILVSTKDTATQADLPESEQEEAKKKAEELYERAKGGEDFDALVSEYSEDPGSLANPDGYVFTDNEMVQEFQDGTDSIGVGEFTLVKTTYGYHVIQRLALDETPEFFEEQYEKVADRIETLMENKRFENQVYAWADEYSVETKVDDAVIDEIVKANG